MNKRLCAMLVVVTFCVAMMALPASASTAQIFDEFEFFDGEAWCVGFVPDGKCTMGFYLDGTLYTCDPFFLVFAGESAVTDNEYIVRYFEDYVTFTNGVESIVLRVYVNRWYNRVTGIYDAMFGIYSGDDATVLGDESNFVVTVVAESPGVSDMVNSDVMSSVLDGVVALLPVVLVAIVGYIALRKGLAWLRDVLHQA